VIQHPIHHQPPEHDQQRYAQQRQALRRGDEKAEIIGDD